TDSCLAVSMKLQVLTTRTSASSGWEVRRTPARSSRPIMTSESTRFLGQPNEIKPTEGAVGGDGLVTCLLYREAICPAEPAPFDSVSFGKRWVRRRVVKSISAGSYAT